MSLFIDQNGKVDRMILNFMYRLWRPEGKANDVQSLVFVFFLFIGTDLFCVCLRAILRPVSPMVLAVKKKKRIRDRRLALRERFGLLFIVTLKTVFHNHLYAKNVNNKITFLKNFVFIYFYCSITSVTSLSLNFLAFWHWLAPGAPPVASWLSAARTRVAAWKYSAL